MMIKKKLSKPIIDSLFINIILYLVVNCISYSKFSCNIDVMIQTLLCDLTGMGGNSYVLFSNIFLMKILKVLYKICPMISWYMLLQVVLCFSSLVSLGNIYLTKKNNVMHKIFYIVFVFFVGFECYIYPNYMKSSFLLCFAMSQILFSLQKLEKKNILKLIVVVIGMILSGMLSIIGFGFGIGVSLLLFLIQAMFSKQYRKCYIFFMSMFLICILGVSLVEYGNYKVYASEQEQWQTMKEFRFAIEKVEVFGYPEYQKSFADELGIDEENYTY